MSSRPILRHFIYINDHFSSNYEYEQKEIKVKKKKRKKITTFLKYASHARPKKKIITMLLISRGFHVIT